MTITHVLWDWNGTLLDDLELCLDTINVILGEEGLRTVDLDTYREAFRFPIVDYYAALGLNVSGGNFERLADRYMGLYLPKSAECGLVEGAEATLRGIRDLGLTQVILSASRRDYLERQVAHAGIRDYFAELLGIGDIHARSKREVGLAWQRESGVSGERILMIGDTFHDAEVAESLGARFLYYRRGHQKLDETRVESRRHIQALTAILGHPELAAP